ncbi:DUF3231 family protein [bacterium BFN5]|nr:DUF3231 family protein [bacterium BFN5]QJW46891.1 DUF3231 family protein [bacterium BFN5]
MSQNNVILLTSSEIANLWIQYQNDTLVSCVFKFFIAKAEDDSVREIVKYALEVSEKHISFIKQTLQGAGHAIPAGFTDADVNVGAERLFGDHFPLHYLFNMSRLGVSTYGMAYCSTARSDIRRFYKQSIEESLVLNEKVVGLMLNKGIYIRTPPIPAEESVHFAKKQAFLGSLFKELRPLTVIEILNLFVNLQTNAIGKAIMTAFSQVVASPEIRDYFLRGKEIAQKHMDVFTDKLLKDELSGTIPLEVLITKSTQPPFSDRLMLFHTAALIQAGIGNYGLAIASSQRYDLVVDYTRLMIEVGAFADDGANLMIEKGWFEEPPQAVNRKELALSH